MNPKGSNVALHIYGKQRQVAYHTFDYKILFWSVVLFYYVI